MIPEAKARFDSDYIYIRTMLIQGTITLTEAKEWVKLRGNLTIYKMREEHGAFLEKFIGTRASRDVDGIMLEDEEDV